MMARNHTFLNDREPLRDHNSLRLDNKKIHGPFSFLNPTRAHFQHVESPPKSSGSENEEGESTSDPVLSEERPVSNVEFKWTARNNRKGRHALAVRPSDDDHAHYLAPSLTSEFQEILCGIGRMFTYYPVWDVSYLVATIFTLGSVVWVINAFFALLPDTNPRTDFNGEVLYGGGITAFIGATIFEIGSFLLMAEAVNEHRTGCFGWALEEAWGEHFIHNGERGNVLGLKPDSKSCTHHHQNKRNLVGKHAASTSTDKSTVSADGRPKTDQGRAWVWFPSWYELRTHYFYELGFLACVSQLIGASVFWISGLTALPGINNILSQAALDGIYWTPQVIGGSGFVISGTLFMLETQEKWWKPAFGTLGWHIGIWNLIGGVGFTLCPCFGYDTATWSQFQASCSTFWGSWAFLIGSTIQWYESLDKHPVEKLEDDQN